MAVTIAGRTSLAGDEVELLLLAGGQRWCAAIHLGSGALLSARWAEPTTGLAPLLLARARVAGDQREIDPLRPEELVLAGPPRPAGDRSTSCSGPSSTPPASTSWASPAPPCPIGR